mgnify:CR=1 FL=1
MKKKNDQPKKSKKAKTKVLTRHKLLIKKILENLGNGMSLGEAMRQAGYSDSYSDNPQQLQGTDSWITLTDEYISDKELMEMHRKLLHKEEVIAKNNNKSGKVDIVRTGEIDPYAVKSALDMAYKLKKKYDNTITIKGKLSNLSDEEVEGRIAGILSGVIGALAGKGKKGKS